MTKELLADLDWRGLIAQTTDRDALTRDLDSGPISFYVGFDPTAASLHIGNLAVICTMRRFQLAGHKPIPLVGGATGLVGDPSGRNEERSLNDESVVVDWVNRIRKQLEQFLSFEGANSATMANNLDWTAPISALEFLRDIGKHFSVNQMLSKDSVSARLEGGGISYTEFSYQVLQALDYLELYRRQNCTLQMGGSDQWGNIVAGLDLIRKVEGGTGHALTIPLITKSDGNKFGKSVGGSVWLDPEMTSPYAFFQFWIGVQDADVEKLLKVFSFKSREEIEVLLVSLKNNPGAREAHRALDEATLQSALSQLPRAEIKKEEIIPSWVDLLVATGVVDSKSAARRIVKEGGAYLNNEKISGEDFVPSIASALYGRFLILRKGKRDLAAIELI